MIKTVTYAATTPGPKLLVIGAIHGNEKCGAIAINRALGEFDAGKLRIAKGQVTFIPVCNPRAHEEDRRFVERNLNRYLVPMENPDSYEARLGNILCPLFAACNALLDIHSYTIGGDPFISYDGHTPEEREFAKAIGAPILITGWGEVYEKMGKGRATSTEEATGGPQYARRFGAAAVTLECGQHKDPKAPDIAYQGILNALRHFEMLAEDAGGKGKPPPSPKHVHMTHVFYRDEGGELAKNWKNFAPVKKGAVLATYSGGKNIIAEADGFVILPKPDCPTGEEWFYFGMEKSAV